jgi:SAM-dependent methyltransferase
MREALIMIFHEDHTLRVARDWKVHTYYDRAEEEDWLEEFWGPKARFRQLFDSLNTRVLVDLACGHGRHTAHILANPRLACKIERMYMMDINDENISLCKERFSFNEIVHPMKNNGYDFSPLENESVTALFCYDAMVHFEYDAVISYIEDARRVLAPGGRALLHHSNYDKSPGAFYETNPLGRNFMSKNLFAHVANRAGFNVIVQFVIDWGDYRKIDCISLIEKNKNREQIVLTDVKKSRLFDQVLHRRILRKVKQNLSKIHQLTGMSR